MPDRGKIIGSLEVRITSDTDAGYSTIEIPVNEAERILALLKEQEVKTGKWIDHTYEHGDDIECPFCHKKWNVIDNCTETFDYCPECGAKLSKSNQ